MVLDVFWGDRKSSGLGYVIRWLRIVVCLVWCGTMWCACFEMVWGVSMDPVLSQKLILVKYLLQGGASSSHVALGFSCL